MRPRLLAVAVGATAALLALPACATTYDGSLADAAPDTAPTVATTTTVPSGPADVLLPRLVDEASQLSTLMLDGGDEDAAVRRIEELWTAVKTEVNERRPDLLSDFSTNVRLTGHAVRFSRAADADKAAKNLDTLAEAYLAS